MAAPPESLEVREVRSRAEGQYLPAWCAASWQPEPYDPSNFETKDWSFLTPGLAHWFLIAMDKGVVEASDGGFKRGDSWSEGIFERAGRKGVSPRPMKLRKESFLEIAAVGMLAVRYGWPAEHLRFQSPRWAFDLLAYVDAAWSEVAIAGEAKLTQKEAVALSASIGACGGRGDHLFADCTRPPNHHKKYAELLELRARNLWIVGPDAFAGDPDLVFRVKENKGGIVRLDRTDAGALTFAPR